MEIKDAKNLTRSADGAGQDATVTQLYPGTSTARGLLAVDLVEIEPGGHTTLHTHGEEHVLFVISGSGEMASEDGAATAMVRANSVVYIAPHEAHLLRNTGGERLRALVTTPLLAWSDRALGIIPTAAQPQQSRPTAVQEKPQEAITEPARPASVAETRVRTDRPAKEQPPTQTPQPAVQNGEVSLPDISSLMKRGSEVAATSPAERPRRAPEPPPQAEEPEAEGGEEGDEHAGLMELNIVFDGGSRGNPGQGYGSYLVQSPGRRPVVKRVEFGSNYTNNQAEYDALIACLEYVIERLTVTNRSPQMVALDIKSDSDLLVNQVNGTYKVKDATLRKRHDRVTELLDQFGAFILTWHPREESVRLLGH